MNEKLRLIINFSLKIYNDGSRNVFLANECHFPLLLFILFLCFFFYSIMKDKIKIKPIVQNQIDFWEVLGHWVIVILIHLTHIAWGSNYPESHADVKFGTKSLKSHQEATRF